MSPTVSRDGRGVYFPTARPDHRNCVVEQRHALAIPTPTWTSQAAIPPPWLSPLRDAPVCDWVVNVATGALRPLFCAVTDAARATEKKLPHKTMVVAALMRQACHLSAQNTLGRQPDESISPPKLWRRAASTASVRRCRQTLTSCGAPRPRHFVASL